MWTVLAIGSKQYKVKEGDIIEVQRLKEQPSTKIILENALLLSDRDKLDVGQPYLKNIEVEAEVLGEKKAKKVVIFKFKRRKTYQKKQGHRQILTRLKILKIKKK